MGRDADGRGTDRPRNVALVIGQLSRGGGERYLLETAVHLDRARYRPTVYCLSEETQPLGPLLERAGVPVHVLPRSGHRDLRRALRLARLLRRQRTDLVHGFLFYANPYAVAAARLCGIRPVIVSIQNCVPGRPAWERWAGWAVHGLADHVLANSEEVREYVIDTFGTRPQRVSVILNGVDLSRFSTPTDRDALSRELGLDAGVPLVVTVGRLHSQKRVDRFLEMAAAVRQERGDARFLIVGDGPERASLEAFARRLQLGEAVTFTGVRDDVPAVLGRADVFVLASDYEGSPNVVAEAMASGTPVVATRGAMCRDLLAPSGGGCIADEDTAEELARLVLRVLASPGEAAEMGRRGREFAARELSVARMVRETEALYDRLLQEA